MTPLSRRAQACAPSPTLAITAKANQMKADGINVVAFGAGEPDFDTPDHIKAAAIDALAKGYTKYTPSAGIPALKNAIINKLQRDSGLTFSPAEVIVSCGGKHSLYNIFQVLIDDGDEVIIPAPYWVSYPEQVKLAGGVPVVVQASDDDNFVPSLASIEAAITDRTKVIVINSPSNPTGAMWPISRIREVAELAVSKGIYIISDEIYEKLVYDGEFISVAALSPEIAKWTLTCNGMSKAYSMTGWRLGYVAGDKALVAAMGRIQDQVTSNPTSIAQYAGVAALGNFLLSGAPRLCHAGMSSSLDSMQSQASNAACLRERSTSSQTSVDSTARKRLRVRCWDLGMMSLTTSSNPRASQWCLAAASGRQTLCGSRMRPVWMR